VAARAVASPAAGRVESPVAASRAAESRAARVAGPGSRAGQAGAAAGAAAEPRRIAMIARRLAS
jgi:hypothetical protein